ncbi:unnamed protein product [Adineta steineri]|uniref:Uncharacterized protein n=1 Tax=Adineta steineri TaxID=433720 RepID=A0A814BM06_9BILA|nr:unnamed protein product [Adineta steineri]CAF0929379.1 unnamed protein product [Adineta steineri]
MESNESWENLISRATKAEQIVCRTCKIYNQKIRTPRDDANKKCCCGRLVRRHSFDGECLSQKINKNNAEIPNSPKVFRHQHSTTVPVTIYGTLKSTGSVGCKYIRIDHQLDAEPIYDLLVNDCGSTKPTLILSVYGGAKYFTMTEKLEKEIIRGIIDAAATSSAWILTTGINNGVSKLIGEGISHYRLLKANPNKIICIGLTKWGTINESTRFELKHTTKGYPLELRRRQISDNDADTDETIERNHTHCILFDDGKLSGYLSDEQRRDLVKEACEDKYHKCYGVTVIVEGGRNTIEVLKNDIRKKRPIVFIEDSGRLADVFASLINQTADAKNDQQFIPPDEVVRKALAEFFPSLDKGEISGITKGIQEILKKENRHLLNVFRMDRDKSVAETIFKAIFTMKNKQNEINYSSRQADEKQNQDQQHTKDEDRLLDLASQWNYFDGALSILKRRQHTTGNNEKIKELFRESLIKNRPVFVEYFLAAGFDPLKLLDIQRVEQQRHARLLKLYEDTYKEINKSNRSYIEELFGQSAATPIETLDIKLNKFIGSFIEAIYSKEYNTYTKRICIDLTNRVCGCCSSPQVSRKDNKDTQSQDPQNDNKDAQSQDQQSDKEDLLGKNKLIRDLFLFSVFMDMPEMAKILLIHQQSRICAALIASAIFKRYSKKSLTVNLKEKFQIQADDFGKYAADFINDCYKYNERSACELLLRQVPLFGNITCMQIAISSESIQLVGTACFDQTLTQVWYNKLSMTNNQTLTRPSQFLSIITFGLLAPWIISYREKETNTQDISLSSKGINYYADEESTKKYWTRFRYFHGSPFIRMCYHFISYIWFLLVFSYMMLYHLDSPDTLGIPHWTEIYVIITVSTMFCEEIRKLTHEYKYRMVERWGSTGSTILTVSTNIFYIAPYLLFYLGLIFRYAGYDDKIFTAGRIIWAFDLELWYLSSLKFVVALKHVGPRLFMLRNMLRDLAAFFYIIFIAIAAYGVVSRALILYRQIPFTGSDILREIFYEPYWFIYGDVSDKDLLDQIISDGTQSLIAEATATHVLLAFHMLFINILILNLLIAVFTDTIDKVKENTEFYWRYQRYSFIREYFEQPPCAYAPLIIVSHIILLIRYIYSKLSYKGTEVNDHTSESITLLRNFKMIAAPDTLISERWDAFESAATHNCARSKVEKATKSDHLLPDDDHSQSTTSTNEYDQHFVKEQIKWKQNGIISAGGNEEGDQLNQLSSPNGIFIDHHNNIFIADFGNHRITKWKYDSNNVQIIAGGNDQLSRPADMIVDKQNNSLIIADTGNRRVIKWSLQNQRIQQILISDIDCFGLSIDKNGFIYVSDIVNNEVRQWKEGDANGTIVAGGNEKGSDHNQLNCPGFIFVDGDDSLYVSDWYNHRVMKWTKNAEKGIIVAGGKGKGSSLKQLSEPQGVIVDHLGQIYVADGGNHRVMRWCQGQKEGEIIVGGNGQGDESNQLNNPYGLSFDDEENLYVVDWGNYRIMKYEKK